MTMSSPVDASALLQNTQAQDILQRKLEMDALQKRLSGQQDEKTRLREACQGFEAVFINKLWEQMRKNVSKEGYLHSKDEETYQSMFDYEFSKKMAEAGGIGLADMLYEQLAQRLGESSRTSSTNIDSTARIVSASSSPGNMRLNGGNAIKPLKGEVSGMAEVRPLNSLKPEIKPFVRDQFAPVEKTAVVTEMDLESISQSMLNNEFAVGESATSISPAGAELNAVEYAVLHSALVQAVEGARSLERDVEEHLEDMENAEDAAALSGARNSPAYEMPLKGDVLKSFGWITDVDGNRHWHQGIDLEAREGQMVKVCTDGKLVFAGTGDGYGDLLILEHAGGWRSFYGNTEAHLVKVGDMLTAGTEFAKVTAKPEEIAVHLHFELRRGELAVNPDMGAQMLAYR